jgi:hypothetical protein
MQQSLQQQQRQQQQQHKSSSMLTHQLQAPHIHVRIVVVKQPG